MWKRLSPQFVRWRWKILSVAVALGAVAAVLLVPQLRVKVIGLKNLVLGANNSPVTIVTDQGIADQLSERVTTLEGQLTALQDARKSDAAALTQLHSDFQAATQEVAAEHDAVVKEAEQLHVTASQLGISSEQDTSPAPASIPSETTTSKLISINTATAAQLDTLPGIGPAYAQRIIDYRTEHGAFKSIDGLDKVSGIGPATIAKIRDLVEL